MPRDVSSFLKENALSIWDHARLHWKDQVLEGMIPPQPLQGNTVLVLKLNTGYKMGFNLSNIQKVDKIISPNSVSSPQKVETNNPHLSDKPAFSVIGVGGTIVSKVDYEKGGVTAKLTPTELAQMVPEIGEFAQIKQIFSPFTKMSEDMIPSDWVNMANICHEELNKPDVEGIVLTHGTDTLHYTAAALSFMLHDISKPVVLVGSQRSSDRGSSDATMNLVCAARVAISDMAEVGICMHGTTSDDYCLFNRGTAVRKMHTTRRDAFRPINQLPIAKVWPDGKMEKISAYHPRSNAKMTLDAVFDENVGFVKVYPGLSPDIFDFYLGRGCKGFVIEATGLGHVHTTRIIPAIQSITGKGIPVFITSQTLYGRVNLDVYTNLRLLKSAGAVGLEDMLPETAYIKLGWVLAHTQNKEKVTEMMLTNYAGETTPFSRTDTFLY
jgi:glutamyl-tRNA(Gln) amidotransferase subunit D